MQICLFTAPRLRENSQEKWEREGRKNDKSEMILIVRSKFRVREGGEKERTEEEDKGVKMKRERGGGKRKTNKQTKQI